MLCEGKKEIQRESEAVPARKKKTFKLLSGKCVPVKCQPTEKFISLDQNYGPHMSLQK